MFAALLFFFPALSLAEVSTNIPLESRVYSDLEYLEVRGFIESGMLSTRPFTWTEGARLFSEARGRWEAQGSAGKARSARAGAVIRRLARRFEREAPAAPQSRDGGRGVASFRPEKIYLRYVYADNSPFFASANNNGDELSAHSNLRAGFDAQLRLPGSIAVYMNPEYRSSEDISDVDLVRGYAIANLGNFQFEAGRDSMWWGAGHNGNLLITNNAVPLEMFKLTSRNPFTLPWVFRRLGLIKPTLFLARLEHNREYPGANLLGMRLDMRFTPHFQLALNRVFMFGGEGKRSLKFKEWFSIFTVSDTAERSGSPIDGNQIASVDASFVYAFSAWYVPATGVKLYTEWGAEDSSGTTKTPSGRANVCGLFLTGPLWLYNADLRVEWANTARNARYGPTWYEHAAYSNGYRYRGRVIGHHIGGDKRDLFVRFRYHAASRPITFGIEYEYLKTGIHSSSPSRKSWYEMDLFYAFNDNFSVKGVSGFEDIEDIKEGRDGYVTGLSLLWVW
ncbi:MAG: capsule assembly Wzi family protein [Thermodesulfobacteriota bacterium]